MSTVPETQAPVVQWGEESESENYGLGIHVYGRQSDIGSYGNSSTTMQGEDLLPIAATALNVDPLRHRWFRQYPVEVMSGLDAGIEIDYGLTAGSVLQVGYPREELMNVFRQILADWQQFQRGAIIVVYKLNRLGRSMTFMPFLDDIYRRARGHVRIWSAKEGWVDPGTLEGRMILFLHCGVAGNEESNTKSHFVKDAHRTIAEQDGTRSLGERTIGYRIEERKGEGQKRVYKYHVRDDEPHPYLNGMSQVALVQQVFADWNNGQGLRQIVRDLNSRGLKHPHTGRKFSTSVVRNILTESMYVGKRVRLKYKSPYVGAKITVRRAAGERISCPYAESLRLLDDITFQKAQDILAENLAPEGRKSAAGRKPQHLFYFAKTSRLRCAGCGGALTLADDHGQYVYICMSRGNNFGQWHCQSHDAKALDEMLDAELIQKFSEFSEFVRLLERELAADTGLARKAELERNLAKAKKLMAMREEAMFDGDLTVESRKRMKEQYNASVSEVSRIEHELGNFGDTVDVQRKKKQIDRARILASFQELTKAERKAQIQHYLEKVWVWPDGGLYVERKTKPLNLEEHPIYVGPGREVLFTRDWPLIDFDRVKDGLRLLAGGGYITKGDLFPWVAKTTAKRLWESNFESPSLNTLLRAYLGALDAAYDVAALRAHLESLVRRLLAEGKVLSHMKEALSVAQDTLPKLRDGKPLARNTYFTLAEKLGIDVEEFRPSIDLYTPDYLLDMVYWIDANQGYGMCQRAQYEIEHSQAGKRDTKLARYLSGDVWGEIVGRGRPRDDLPTTITDTVISFNYLDFRDLILRAA